MSTPLIKQIRLMGAAVFFIGFGCGVTVGVIIMRIMIG